ncbi:MAG: type II toxin-antitoxin system VapC family toxin [Methylococcales bacterium]|nr:type II toxin-antitoxin system VapC family toxin [Methylococcales bacterium]
MADYLLCDTCVIIDFINARSTVLNDLLAKDTHLFVNSIIEMELLQGARDKRELQVIKKKLLSFRLLDLQQVIFDSATELMRDYRLSHGLALPDAVIGSTAIYYQIPLYTYNQKDFRFLPEINLTQFDKTLG